MVKIHLFLLILTCVLMACVGSKKAKSSPVDPVEKQTSTLPNSVIPDQFIVKLKSNIDPSILLESFQSYGLSFKKPINKGMNLWVVNYDTDTIAPEKMLQMLKASKNVDQAEFDKKLNPRR